MGGGAGKSQSSSRQQSSGSSSGAAQSFVDPNQQGFLDFLRAQGQGVAQGQLGAGGVGDIASQLSGTLLGQGQDVLGSLFGGPQGQTGGIIDQLRNPEFLQGGQAQLDPVIGQLGADINRQLQRQLTGAGGIASEAAAAGNLGGGRDQVQRGIAQEGALETFGREAGQLRLGQFQQGQELQAGLLGQAGQLAGAQEGQQIGAQLGGLGELSSLFNLGLAPGAAGFAPLQMFAALLGDPTILSQSFNESSQQSTGRSSANSFQFAGGVTGG